MDGTTQLGYRSVSIPDRITPDTSLPPPIVAIAPTPQTQILRGLTILADRVTIRGLSVYGFQGRDRETASLPPADIWIGDRLPTRHRPPSKTLPPEGVVIEQNWLGIAPTGVAPNPASAFGVWITRGRGTQIRGNRIAAHQSSGIFTLAEAENLQISANLIEGNGFTGMPDAIRLEGQIQNTAISGNLIRGNAGSAIYLFKPVGAVDIHHNQITGNGKQGPTAAIYLMGNDHRVMANEITDQSGAGVVVTAAPPESPQPDSRQSLCTVGRAEY